MKVKLKDIKNKMPHNNSFCGFSTEDWNSLNQGKSIEVNLIPESAKDFCEAVSDKKEGK